MREEIIRGPERQKEREVGGRLIEDNHVREKLVFLM
jgi:hypothetical protein